MKIEVILAGLFVGAGIAVAGLSQRYELSSPGLVAWRVDRLTGDVHICDARLGSDSEPRRECLRVKLRTEE